MRSLPYIGQASRLKRTGGIPISEVKGEDMENNNILSVQEIVKEYPGVKALDKVSLDFRKGEIHALMGENGAGKSTLIKVIAGAIQPDSGAVYMDGKKVDAMDTKISKDLGIAIIYQELMMVPALSVSENVFLGSAVRKGVMIERKEMERRSRKIFEDLGIKIDVRKPVGKLTVAYQQMVEIARALSKDARVLIMDEPSAALTEEEVQTMLQLVLKLKEAGVTIIYVSHRLDEVFQITDRISVLRDGQYITTLNTKDTDKTELIHYMVGRDLNETFPARNSRIGEVGLEIRNFSGNGVKDISLSVRHGEILGLGGLVGAGRTELAQLIYGLRKPEAGELYLDGKQTAIRSPKQAVRCGMGLIPEDRKQLGLLLDFDLQENISLPSLPRISRGIMISKRQEGKRAQEPQTALNIKTPTMKQKAKNLSGGNQQKVVLAKWLGANCEYLIFDEPTRGIDVGAKQEIYKLLNQLAEEGKCILMISSEMEELIGVSDRIIVLCEGRKTGELSKDEFSQDRILSLASGT